MEEVSLLIDAVKQLDELFLLVIVVSISDLNNVTAHPLLLIHIGQSLVAT